MKPIQRLTLCSTLALAALAATTAQAYAADLPRTYIVTMKAPGAATYKGGVTGLAATQAKAGARLEASKPEVVSYTRFIRGRRMAAVAAVAGVPSARLVHEYNYALNGMALVMTEAQARVLQSHPDVASVVVDSARKPLTNRTPTFLGLTAPAGLWSQRDASALPVKGENMIVGVIDSGIWPDNPSFADRADAQGRPTTDGTGTLVYGAPPARWKGRCVPGPGFGLAQCNRKLIGARAFRAGFDASGRKLASLDFDSPRDSTGHGSHTSSIAAGNENVAALSDGVPLGVISGMAPRARIATYKVCWTDTTQDNRCNASDSVAAIDQAVADGVDVINFSISGPADDLNDPVEQAFLNAAEAGVFVAAAAGNVGANLVNHPSPWLTTVGATTTDKNFTSPVNLGNGLSYRSASTADRTVRAPLILAGAAAARPPFDDSNILARLCATNALDPAKVAGKIVVCDRGTTPRLDKSAEVKRAGGVGALIVNVLPRFDDLNADPHMLPAVALLFAARAAVRAYAGTPGATASIGVAEQTEGLVAPVVTPFSSLGPNLADNQILKPDLGAPGANILAALIPRFDQAEHDAIVAGTAAGRSNAATAQGTSMASPHVAGVALLLRQLRPDLSPAAIRSMLITSAGPVRHADGSIDTDRFGFGGGQLNPNAAAQTDLVFDAERSDYDAYLCGLGLLAARSPVCLSAGSISGKDLNEASLSAEVVGATTLKRRITNVARTPVQYTLSGSVAGFDVAATPSRLKLAPGQTQEVSYRFSFTGVPDDAWRAGSLVWSDGQKQLTNPVVVRGRLFRTPAVLDETQPSGSTVFQFTTGFDGRLDAVPSPLATAKRTTATIERYGQSCFPVAAPAGTSLLRAQLFDSETSNPGSDDLSIQWINAAGDLLAETNVVGSNESLDLVAPAPGAYEACVLAIGLKSDSTQFTLSTYVVSPTTSAPAPAQLKVQAPSQAVRGQTQSATVSWSAPAGQRAVGVIAFSNNEGRVVGSTVVSIDPVSVGRPARVTAGPELFAR